MRGRQTRPSTPRGKSGAQMFRPSQLSDLYAWWRADLGVTLNGATVASWTDQKQGFVVSQGVAAAQPTYTASGIGGQPSLTFDGGDYLQKTTGFSLSQPDTIYVVGYTLQDATREFFDADSGVNRQILYGSSPSTVNFYAGSAVSQATTDITTAKVFGVVFNGASSALYINDSQTAYKTGNPGAGGLATLVLGGGQGGASLSSGRIAEFIFCSSAHDASTRQRVMRYLGARYGLSVT